MEKRIVDIGRQFSIGNTVGHRRLIGKGGHHGSRWISQLSKINGSWIKYQFILYDQLWPRKASKLDPAGIIHSAGALTILILYLVTKLSPLFSTHGLTWDILLIWKSIYKKLNYKKRF